ncbi:ABC transporter permease [Sediminispirochaeta smaragdinae]|uniref:Binding-protein-dependent transport systems inner membrane component n=1 Tax=Sediminispirochaeta smaragdinae (strain DSM 11293 / JCM 15392 / SEBR 4228) TaxID=573413 RepID=E1R137_SEDSS|nr:ABC transporter permease [Sediminispirochaeta smaragdinae]ADK80286.1 binding-protein-dependent transport systems inner membrane component [Sediminispirochaeta smaragdinae DSM 11293]
MGLLKELLHDKIGRIGLIGVFIVLLTALFAPLIAPHDPVEMFPQLREAPGKSFIMGTDNFGRDVFSRIVYGARVSIMVGLISVGIGASLGIVLGLAAGYFSGWLDNIIMRLMDILFAFPSILLALSIVSVLGPDLQNTIIAIGIVRIPIFTRTVRAEVLSVKSQEYITSARSIGIKDSRIIIRHIMPNIISPFLVQATLSLSSAILVEASLSFLGLGIQPPNPSWGSMLNESRKIMELAPWTALYPAIAIILTILSFNLLGDSLRDILDPKLRNIE